MKKQKESLVEPIVMLNSTVLNDSDEVDSKMTEDDRKKQLFVIELLNDLSHN